MGCDIDWAATGAMISAWGTWGGVGAVLYAAWKAGDVFDNWRKQKREERRMQVAEHVLTCAYDCQRALSAIRSPFVSGGESNVAEVQVVAAGFDRALKTARQWERLTTGQVYLSRVDRHKDAWEKLTETLPVAKAIYGQDIEGMLNNFFMLRANVMTAAQTYATAGGPEEQLTELRGKFCEFATVDVDTIKDGAARAIASLEERLLPVLRDNYKPENA